MSQAFHLTNSDVMNNCINEVINAFQSGKEHVVTIKNAKESRSDAQHRLRWLWFTQLERQLAGVGKGRDKEQWNLFFKAKFLRSILIEQDESYVRMFNDYDAICEILKPFEQHLKAYKTSFWGEEVKTKKLSVKSMARWLDSLDKYVTFEYQVTLITPDDLGWVR